MIVKQAFFAYVICTWNQPVLSNEV